MVYEATLEGSGSRVMFVIDRSFKLGNGRGEF
jgi:hypothetical protein